MVKSYRRVINPDQYLDVLVSILKRSCTIYFIQTNGNKMEVSKTDFIDPINPPLIRLSMPSLIQESPLFLFLTKH